MRLQVTKPITSHGRYFAAGEIVEMPPERARVFRSLYKWAVLEDVTDEIVSNPDNVEALERALEEKGPVSVEDGPLYADWYKSDLVAEAESRGFETSGLKKAELVALLEDDDA